MMTLIGFKISVQSNRRYGAIIIQTASNSFAGYRYRVRSFMEWLNLILGLDLNHDIRSLDIPGFGIRTQLVIGEVLI
jgi:hypothetical protein